MWDIIPARVRNISLKKFWSPIDLRRIRRTDQKALVVDLWTSWTYSFRYMFISGMVWNTDLGVAVLTVRYKNTRTAQLGGSR